jgi:ABC-type Mn2+/Zn2+ transport system ATPase subunit
VSSKRLDKTLLRVEGLAAGYGSRAVIRDVSFAVEAGERVAVLGPNGGGKTTLLRTLLGDLPPLSGQVRCEHSLAAVPQTDRSRLDYPVSALDVVIMGCLPRLAWWRRPGRHEREQAKAALARVGLGDLWNQSFGELSGGQRQRVLIARGLVQEAPLLLLDEPFVGLDHQATQALEDLLADLASDGHALLIATHDIAQAQRWERVLCLNGIQIAYGSPPAVLIRETLQRTYGGEIIDIPGGGSLLPAHHHEECSRS